jgi:hypothetical protein
MASPRHKRPSVTRPLARARASGLRGIWFAKQEDSREQVRSAAWTRLIRPRSPLLQITCSVDLTERASCRTVP